MNLSRPGTSGGSVSCEDGARKRATRYPLEFRERAVRMVLEHQGEHPSQRAAIRSIAGKLGCTEEALRRWVGQAERDAGAAPA